MRMSWLTPSSGGAHTDKTHRVRATRDRTGQETVLARGCSDMSLLIGHELRRECEGRQRAHKDSLGLSSVM
jgi:hypothetical protein